MKTIAILTDIHGNHPALQAVLQDIAKKKVEHIYCLGDVVGIGPDSNQVLEQLTTRPDMSFVMGNHDLAVIAAARNEPPPEGHHNERQHHEWLAKRIEPKYIEVMSKWPMSVTISILHHELLFCHYHLDPSNWFVPIDKLPTTGALEEIYSTTDNKLVCFGHHHIVHHFRSDTRLYFNPGSLGCYDKPYARYGIVTISEKKIMAEVQEVPYNNVDFLRSYEELQVPDREFILKIFHGGQYL
ncbi:metallophosphoesterase family protein [Paenibacillus sp. 19GGS1-52]|uniref:metallophosphoesterase family protein n=1 Tax=Paenibacillus sp. 19GGS1-52 TaxID=2758563 RepID=UPI001EFAB7CA|nr:metallophosphoesterase family protein [Paenibacillus sp. 19GGS1-52]ULO06535.1 metallophosphoesterase family protein [Paenibacillus sp. 19GGS1-52]